MKLKQGLSERGDVGIHPPQLSISSTTYFFITSSVVASLHIRSTYLPYQYGLVGVRGIKRKEGEYIVLKEDYEGYCCSCCLSRWMIQTARTNSPLHMTCP